MAWLGEMALRLSHAAVMLVSNPEGEDRAFLTARTNSMS